MGWRLYARRTTTGLWLDTDVQMSADLVDGINGTSEASASIPYALDRPASDGAPKWLERGTTLYAEQDGQLKWVGLCDYAQPGSDGKLELGFAGLSSAYDLIWFNGRIRLWEPNPYAVVESLLANAHAQPDGNIGMTVVRDGLPIRSAGDAKPGYDRPKKPPRRAGESREDYDDRLLKWESAVDEWERRFGKLEPYSLGWWEQQYVGDEIRELAEEIPFVFYERHAWTNKAALTAKHDLILSAEYGERRQDVALVEGNNLTEAAKPETNTDVYGNHVIVLGAGEGSGMARGEFGQRDLRIRTTRFSDLKTVKSQQRLIARAKLLHSRATTSVALDTVVVTGRAAATIRLGDEVPVTSRHFTGWCRVSAIGRSTTSSAVTLEFDRTTDGIIR